MTSKQLLYY